MEMKDATKSGVAQVSKMLEKEKITETVWDTVGGTWNLLLGANTAELLLNTV